MMKELITFEEIKKRIYLIRGRKVMLDSDLAELYGVETFNLNKAVKRNIERFPDDFMFQLTKIEHENLLFQIGMSKTHGGRRTPPYAFGEQGVAMLSSVLRSKRAIQVNISIMRAFIQQRKQLSGLNKENLRLDIIERRLTEHDEAFTLFNDIILPLLESSERPKRKIGFKPDKKKDKN